MSRGGIFCRTTVRRQVSLPPRSIVVKKSQTNPSPPFFPSLHIIFVHTVSLWLDRSSSHSSSPSPHTARSLISWARASIAILRSKVSRSRSKSPPTARNRSRSLAGACISSQKNSAFSASAPCCSLSSKTWPSSCCRISTSLHRQPLSMHFSMPIPFGRISPFVDLNCVKCSLIPMSL